MDPIKLRVFVEEAHRVLAAGIVEGELLTLIGLFGLTGAVHEIECQSPLSTANSRQIHLLLPTSCTLAFAGAVGCRHCIRKQPRLSVAAGWCYGVNRRVKQEVQLLDAIRAVHDGLVKVTWPQAMEQAYDQFTYSRSCCPTSTSQRRST